MEDTDWRPSSCPLCGEMREARRTPVCQNPKCDCYVNMNRTMKTQKHYIWSKQGHALVMVNDIKWLCKNPEYDPDEDKIYELGPEVKIEMVVKVIPVIPAKQVFRGRGMHIITTNRTKPITRGHEGADH